MTIDEMNEKCRKVKLRMLQMCIKAGIGHVTTAFSCTEILVALYYNLMNIRREEPRWEDRDRFVMSKNHAAIMLFPTYAEFGWVREEDLDNYRSDNSVLDGHTHLRIPGTDFGGGALGIGLGVACGIAYAAKADGKSWKTYCLIGDGEAYEGSIWESAMFAGHNKLSNLIVFLDRNRLCVTDFNEKLVKQEPFDDKWRSFGWYVDRINGHDIAAIIDSVHKAETNNPEEKPVMIICDTIKGHGIDFLENALYWHGFIPKGEKAERALRQLGGGN